VSALNDIPVDTLSFEAARDELVKVVEALAARCEEWLVGAKRRLDAARATASDGAES
jgi:exodeoxyribonuclease VII small subunit